jgi:hypothetical protein
MTMDQSAVFLAGSILTALGFVVVILAIVVVNNVLHKYWKPVRIFTSDSWAPFSVHSRYATEEELARITPHLAEENVQKETSKKV